MKVTVSEPEAGKKLLEIEVPPERVQSALEAAYTDYQKRVQIPGFRKGKVPLGIIKSKFGRAIESKVIDDLISKTYEAAQKEQGLNPAGAVQVEGIEREPGKPLKYKATVEVLPEVTLKEYEGIEVTKEIPRISEEDVDRALESLRDQYAEVATVEDVAKEGHFIVADIQALDRTWIPIVGDKVENADFQLGQSPFGQEFDKGLEGMRRGEERVVRIVDPKSATRERYFSVKIKEIKEKRLPKLDDELARTVGGLTSLEELRRELRADLMRKAELEAEGKVRDQVVDHLTKENPIPVPERMIVRVLASLISDIKERSQEPLDEEVLRTRYRPLAVNRIRLHLILEEIGRREHIDGGDEKVLDYLVAKAKIREVQPV
ncbi:MAG: trigger factor [bacterium]